MEPKDTKYPYAEKQAQLKRANRFAQIGYTVFYTIALATLWIACAMGKHSMLISLIITAVIISSTILTFVTYMKNNTGTLTRYVALIGLLVVAFLTGTTFDNYYIRFMACIPLVACVLFFDLKFTVIAGSAMTILNFVTNFININIQHLYTSDQIREQICASLAVGL